MPIDRNTQNTLKPKLASNRTAKTPLTPRLAGAPSVAAPASTVSSRTVRSSNGTTPRVNNVDDVTPVKAFLNSNVTPRSSSRKSRIGVGSPTSTPNETPTSTPTTSRPASTVDFAPREPANGYGAPGGYANNYPQGGLRPRSTHGQHGNTLSPSPRLPPPNAYSPGPPSSTSTKDASSMFFHASQARPQEQAPPPQKKGPVFFYANGQQDEASRRLDTPSPPLSAMSKAQTESKFFHADTLSEVRSHSPAVTPPPISTSPRPTTVQEPPVRSQSPTKEWAHLSYRKGASQVMRPALVSRTSGLSILSGPLTPELPDNARRRSSTTCSAVRGGGHVKSASLSSIDSVTSLKKVTSNEAPVITPSPLHRENRVFSNVSLPESVASAPSPSLATFSGLPSPGPTSPTKGTGTQSALEAMNELAANARRERKVLDLEISNSSLLAINRSLEKEVRKQKAELRRFRRLSRAGRFSMDTVGSAIDSFSPGASPLGDLSDMSEEEEIEEEEPEEDPESSDSSFDEGQLSPTAQEAKVEAHRLRDEKRLQLDLSKHRELLIDSQKMNQSLKRCMNWTEQLIKDGQKALEYQVRVSDVKLGGRVLISEDDHEITHTEESKGLLSPWSPLHTAMEALDSPFFPDASRLVDRDSGVDVDGIESDIADPSTDTALLGSPFEERIRRLHASIEALEES